MADVDHYPKFWGMDDLTVLSENKVVSPADDPETGKPKLSNCDTCPCTPGPSSSFSWSAPSSMASTSIKSDSNDADDWLCTAIEPFIQIRLPPTWSVDLSHVPLVDGYSTVMGKCPRPPANQDYKKWKRKWTLHRSAGNCCHQESIEIQHSDNPAFPSWREAVWLCWHPAEGRWLEGPDPITGRGTYLFGVYAYAYLTSNQSQGWLVSWNSNPYYIPSSNDPDAPDYDPLLGWQKVVLDMSSGAVPMKKNDGYRCNPPAPWNPNYCAYCHVPDGAQSNILAVAN